MGTSYTVIWELRDGQTQDNVSDLTLEQACELLPVKAKELNGEFNWIQIERI